MNLFNILMVNKCYYLAHSGLPNNFHLDYWIEPPDDNLIIVIQYIAK